MQVTNFAVIRQGIGRIQWNEPVDVRGLNLGAVVRLSKGSVEVYLDDADKPDIGDGLNKPATVCCKSGADTKYIKYVNTSFWSRS